MFYRCAIILHAFAPNEWYNVSISWALMMNLLKLERHWAWKMGSVVLELQGDEGGIIHSHSFYVQDTSLLVPVQLASSSTVCSFVLA